MNCLLISTAIIMYCMSYVQSSDEVIAFSAIKGERNGPYISYQTMLSNSSAKFNPLYGVFMCTEPGLYLFTFHALAQKDSDLRVSLRTNRIPTITAFSGSRTSYNMASGTTILELEVDDIVYLFVEDGDFYESRQVNRAYTSFTGYRIGSPVGAHSSGGSGFFSSLMGRKASVVDVRRDRKNGDMNEKLDTEFIQIDSSDNIYNLLNKTKNSTEYSVN